VRRGGTALGEGMREPQNPEWVKFPESMMPLMRIPAQIMAAEFHKGGSSYDLALIANFLHPFSIHPPAPLLWPLRTSGDAYTFAELERISKGAAFARVDLAPPEIGLDRLVMRTGELRKSPQGDAGSGRP
jgi:hypothetical protein